MKVGIIGLGAIAPLHIGALQSLGQEIVAICDIDLNKCKEANERFSLCATEYTDYKAMLQNEQLDVVHICTPHYLHAEMTCYALAKDINVLCEKPLAISIEQLDQIEQAVKNSKAKLGVCFQNRYNASVRYIKEFFSGKQVKAASANLIWCRDKDYYHSGEWRGTKAQEGGGVMINQAIHSLDLLQWICGMPETVIAHVSNNSLQGVIEVEDTAYGLFSLQNGGNFIINATNAAAHSFPVFCMFQAGTDMVELSADNLIVNGQFLAKKDLLPILGKNEWGAGHNSLIQDYYECLQQNKPFSVDFAEGSKSVRLILKMYQSNGEKININD